MVVKTKPAEMDEQSRPRKSRPQILAGLIILISFGLFCAIVYFAVSLVSDYLSRSTQTLGADLLVRKGPVYITRAGQATKILANPQERVEQGDTISGDEQSYAQLTLFDGSRLDLTGSATLYLHDSKVLTTNFVRKEKKLSVELRPSGSEEGKPGVGQVIIWPANPYSGTYAGQPLTLTTGDGAVLVFDKPDQGNFKIEVQRTADNSSRTIITSPPTNRTALEVRAAEGAQSIEPGQRVIVDRGQAPSEVTGLEDELIRNNGSFINGLDAWIPQKIDNGTLENIQCDLYTDSERIDDGTLTRLHTSRYQDTKDSFECSVRQDLNVDVSRYQSLTFGLKLKVLYQSLTGGGVEGYEFPLFIKIGYVDTNGTSLTYFRGFYITAPDPEKGTRVIKNTELQGAEQVKQGEWKEFVSEDLMSLRPRPLRITSIQVGSAGHDYEAVFTDVSLVGKG